MGLLPASFRLDSHESPELAREHDHGRHVDDSGEISIVRFPSVTNAPPAVLSDHFGCVMVSQEKLHARLNLVEGQKASDVSLQIGHLKLVLIALPQQPGLDVVGVADKSVEPLAHVAQVGVVVLQSKVNTSPKLQIKPDKQLTLAANERATFK